MRAMRTRVVEQGRRVRQGGSRGRGERVAGALWGTAELVVTAGVVVLLLVVHQLWWTNRQASADAEHRVEALERDWGRAPSSGHGKSAEPEEGADPGGGPEESAAEETDGRAGPRQPRWDEAYAVLRIPKLGVTAPVARGVSKAGVLNKGYVGHYPQTSAPGAPGNFAVAGHRNTHGEPFRYLNRLRAGDRVEVDTAEGRYVYGVERGVPETLPGDGTVLDPVPYSSVHPQRRMEGPGHYLTLTTCTPEYTSKYRLVVWGRLLSAGPR